MSTNDTNKYSIALVGGTGPEGKGLATRFSIAGHTVTIGSRDPARGVEIAEELNSKLETLGQNFIPVQGDSNEHAVTNSAIVIVTVPYSGHRATLESLSHLLDGKIVIDTVVPVYFEKGPRPVEVSEGSATEEAAAILQNSNVIGAFHNLSAEVLMEPALSLDSDVLVTGGGDAKQVAIELVRDINGARPVDAGPLRYSRFVEGITILLIGINSRYKSHSGIVISGLE